MAGGDGHKSGKSGKRLVHILPTTTVNYMRLKDGTYELKANTLRAVEKSTGYYVGLYEGTYFKTNTVFDESRAVNYARMFKNEMDGYLGVWTDPQTSITHVDPSAWFETLEEATAKAKELNQLAIWDIANMESIYLS